jgi:PIN domain-containing protein
LTAGIQSPPLYVGVDAQTYSTFAGVLAGFAFLGLSVYLTRSPRDQRICASVLPSGDNVRRGQEPIRSHQIASSTFYAMASLAISSFLYATLAGQISPASAFSAPTGSAAGPPAAEFLTYGLALTLAVLALFYSLTLLLLEYPLTNRSAWNAYWAAIIVGTLIVVRFLLTDVRDTLLIYHPGTPEGMLSTPGIYIYLGLAGSLSVLISRSGILERKPLYRILQLFINSPVAPALCSFFGTIGIAVLVSPYLETRPASNYRPAMELIQVYFGIAMLLVAVFTVAAGSVIGPRVKIVAAQPFMMRLERAVETHYVGSHSPAGAVRQTGDSNHRISISEQPAQHGNSAGTVKPWAGRLRRWGAVASSRVIVAIFILSTLTWMVVAFFSDSQWTVPSALIAVVLVLINGFLLRPIEYLLNRKHNVQAARPYAIIVDTSALMEGESFLTFDWHRLDTTLKNRPLRLIVPSSVIRELDRLKQHQNPQTRMQARHVLTELWTLHQGRPTKAASLPGSQNVTIEVRLDSDGQQQWPSVDGEILDQAMAVHNLNGGHVVIATGDYTLLYQAALVGLTAKLVPHR